MSHAPAPARVRPRCSLLRGATDHLGDDMTYEDIARDLESNGLATTVHDALVSAAEQGAALTYGKADSLIELHDNAYAEWRIAYDEGGDAIAAAGKYRQVCENIAPALVDLLRREDQ